MVAPDGGRCRVIMRDGVLLPGMAMPALGPPPPDPHPNPAVQRLREAWNLKIIAWHGVFNLRRPMMAILRIPVHRWDLPAQSLDEDEETDGIPAVR